MGQCRSKIGGGKDSILCHVVRRSLLERIAGVRLVYERIGLPRALSFEYLNRQLVWHELSELLLFVLPLINVSRIKRFVTNNLPTIQRTSATDNSVFSALLPLAHRSSQFVYCIFLSSDSRPVPEIPRPSLMIWSEAVCRVSSCASVGFRRTSFGAHFESQMTCRDAAGTATAASDDAQQCRICQKAEIVVPFEALPCGHVFCYFCLRSHTLAEPGYQCPRCGETVKALRRYATALVD